MTVQLILEVADASGTKGTSEIKLAGTPTLAQQTGFAVAYSEAVDAVIQGEIENVIAFTRPSTATLADNTIDGNADVERIGKFEFITTGGTKVKLNIPALDEVAANTDDLTDDINVGEAAVSALYDAMVDGIAVTGGTIQPCDIGGLSISNLVFAREGYTNSGKRR